MKNLIYAAAAAALALLLADGRPQVLGQVAPPPPASGVYTTYVGDQQLGTESYSVAASADGTRTSVAEVALAGTKFKATTVVAPDHAPLRYAMEAGGAETLSEEFTKQGVRVRAAGQPAREVAAQPRALLENGVWHQFIFLLAQYDAARGGKQTFDAFLPSQALAFKVTVERAGAPAFGVGGRQVATEHYRAETNLGLGFEIWADAGRTPLLIRIPAQQVRVVRKGSEELAAAVFPAAPAARPASPDDPYTGEEVSFQNGGQKLAGTLTLPKRGAAPFPAAVIISGSGSQDRDGSTIAGIYRLIAERLSSAGVAVLRADDRGSGKSPMPARPTGYRDLVGDTRAAFEYLGTRPEIDPKRVALVGHSEGALTAAVIAAEDRRVAAVALLAGASRPIDSVLVEQTLYTLGLNAPVDPSDEAKMPAVVRGLAEMFAAARSDPKPAGAAADKLSWFRDHLAIDPLEVVRRVRVPVLILNGERDANVLPYHAIELARALAGAGNRRAQVRVFPNLTHLFTPSTLDAGVRGEKAAEVSGEFLQTLETWMAATLGPAAAKP